MKKTDYLSIATFIVVILISMTTHANESHGNNFHTTSINWPLPPSGPKAVKGKKILYIAMNLSNGGILGVAEGLEEATKEIGWELTIVDGTSTEAKIKKILQNASDQNLDGIILGGMNAKNHTEELKVLAEKNIQIVGWHSGGSTGPLEGTPVLINVTTEPYEVAKLATEQIVNNASKNAGVVIFTDSHFEIALTKSAFMQKEIKHCSHCQLLAVVDLSLSEEISIIQDKLHQLLNEYGSRWTHSLGINDLYFDFAAPIFSMHEKEFPIEIQNISAGDGSYSAYLRIKYGGLQYATIPEPLLFHGWQLIDELNRLFNNKPPSNYIAPVIVITENNVSAEINKNNLFDPLNNYRSFYKKIWRGID